MFDTFPQLDCAGRIVTLDRPRIMGIINVNPANSTETSSAGFNDTSALEKDIITIVHTDFQLE